MDAGIWTSRDYVDTSYGGSGAFVMPGESIGRDASGTDTDRSEDFVDHGGADAYWASPGLPNEGPFYPEIGPLENSLS